VHPGQTILRLLGDAANIHQFSTHLLAHHPGIVSKHIQLLAETQEPLLDIVRCSGKRRAKVRLTLMKNSLRFV